MLAWEMTILAETIISPEMKLDGCEPEALSKHLAALLTTVI